MYEKERIKVTYFENETQNESSFEDNNGETTHADIENKSNDDQCSFLGDRAPLH